MPRFALALTLLAGCFFDANYGHARVTCSDGVCPSGMTCMADHVCGTGSAGGDAGGSADGGSGDAHVPALTCADPGDATAGTHPGNTDGHANLQAASCGGAFYNAPDEEYRIEGPGVVTIGIDSPVGLNAYVIGGCTGFPTCETNTAATPSAPLTITLTSGAHIIVVDGIVANVTGAYTLTISR